MRYLSCTETGQSLQHHPPPIAAGLQQGITVTRSVALSRYRRGVDETGAYPANLDPANFGRGCLAANMPPVRWRTLIEARSFKRGIASPRGLPVASGLLHGMTDLTVLADRMVAAAAHVSVFLCARSVSDCSGPL